MINEKVRSKLHRTDQSGNETECVVFCVVVEFNDNALALFVEINSTQSALFVEFNSTQFALTLSLNFYNVNVNASALFHYQIDKMMRYRYISGKPFETVGNANVCSV